MWYRVLLLAMVNRSRHNAARSVPRSWEWSMSDVRTIWVFNAMPGVLPVERSGVARVGEQNELCA
jgi:hypothetical protein